MKDPRIEKLLEILKVSESRRKSLDELRKSSKRMSKRFYLILKATMFDQMTKLREEVGLWEEFKELLENNQIDLDTPESYELLSQLKCMKTNVCSKVDERLKDIDTEIDNILDLLNKTNEAVKEVQLELQKLPPSSLIILKLNPDSVVDPDILEVKIK